MDSKSFPRKITDIPTSEKIIFPVIILSSVVIFLQECSVNHPLLNILDVGCTLIFIVEMIVKHLRLGMGGYWKEPWNKLDGILVILSLPSIVGYLIPTGMADLSFLLILRILRTFRFFRLVRIFPNIQQTSRGLARAVKDSVPVFFGFLLVIIAFALITCDLFRDACPQYFATPWESLYSIFRMCTVEGWYDIPDAVTSGVDAPWKEVAVRIYFIFILLAGGIIGLSLVNSIFVDAMTSDNNDKVEDQLTTMNRKMDELKEQVAFLSARLGAISGKTGDDNPGKPDNSDANNQP